MDDVLHVVVSSYLLLLSPPPTPALLAFVRLLATHRGLWLRYRTDRALWLRLEASIPRWILPEHMGIRRRVITSIRLMGGLCVGCSKPDSHIYMAFQSRICRGCFRRLLISDFELAWTHGFTPKAGVPFISRFVKGVCIRLYLRSHIHSSILLRPENRLSLAQCRDYQRRWPGINIGDVVKKIK